MTSIRASVTALAVLCLLSVVLAHGDEHGHDSGKTMDMGGHGHGNGSSDQPKPDGKYPPTYFALADHAGILYAHIALMTVAWIFVLPVAVMLSIARSRYTLALRFLFMAVNTAGVLLAVIYNANTADLYPGNAHHKVGWIATAVVGTQAGIELLGRFAGVFHKSGPRTSEYRPFLPISAASMAERGRLQGSEFTQPYRLSNDSGQGTEPNTASLRSQSASPAEQSSPRLSEEARKEYRDHADDLEDGPIMPMPTESKPSFLRRVADKISTRAWRVLILACKSIDRIILPLGFIVVCLGIITYGRFFEGEAVYSGLAHWIKGGVFFWLGLFTLGRWSGSFGELGWAWNVRPRKHGSKWRPSAEFVESFLIFFYGATNIFMERLGGERAWNAQDLEHISITVLFIGGGLFGMLIESTRIRNLLNTTVDEAIDPTREDSYTDEEDIGGSESVLKAPPSYEFSVNPIPALVILLLGIMMSSHMQDRMISSMVHKQWGNLLAGASLARGLTYVLIYLKPPRSVYPSRPPTELLAAFGLIAGGVIFMASARDTVEGMVHYKLDAMVMYTVTMGLSGLLMAWVITVLAIKGWAVRKEAALRRAEH